MGRFQNNASIRWVHPKSLAWGNNNLVCSFEHICTHYGASKCDLLGENSRDENN